MSYELVVRTLSSTGGALEAIRKAYPGDDRSFNGFLEGVKAMLKKNEADAGQYAIVRKCSPLSIWDAVRQGALLGLRFDQSLAHAYLVPFGQVCTFMPGYRGLIAIAARTGVVLKLEAEAVFAGDEFQVTLGTDRRIRHVPAYSGKEVTHAYAVATLGNGQTQFAVMDKSDIDHIRGKSKAGGSGPWVSDYTEMAKKTVVKRLFKLIPLSPELGDAIAADDTAERIVDAEVVAPAPVDPSKTKAQRIVESRAATVAENPAVEDAPPDTVDPNAPLTDAEKQEIRDAEAREAQEQTPPLGDVVTGGKKGKVSKAMMQ